MNTSQDPDSGNYPGELEDAMEKRMGQKLVNLFGLMLFGFLIFIGFYHFTQRFASPDSVHRQLGSGDRSNAFSNEKLPAAAAKGKFIFHLNKSQSIGKANLIYRGLEGKTICLIDVIIPELDPERPYKHRLDIDTAEKGFRIAGNSFKLVSVGDTYIRLVKETP